jgi:hypothetical protein
LRNVSRRSNLPIYSSTENAQIEKPKELLKIQFCQQYGFFAMRSIKDKIEERGKREGQWREETAPYTRPQYK